MFIGPFNETGMEKRACGRLILIILFVYPFLLSNASEVDSLNKRLAVYYINTSSYSSASDLLASQNSDGSWPEIDYTYKSRTTWGPVKHLKNVEVIAVAYLNEASALYNNSAALDGVVNGLNFWYKKLPLSDNWWYNDIGKQLELGPVGIMLNGVIPDSIITKITGDLATSTGSWTGQNKVWFAQQIIWRGCLENSAARASEGIEKIKEEVKTTTSEGIQPDYSFQQHGQQIYNSGYGSAFISNSVFWAYICRNLPSFEYSSTQIDILGNLILKGTQWMTINGFWDYQVAGRNIARKSNVYVNINSSLELMAKTDTARTSQYQDYIANNNGLQATALTGNKHFYHSDYHVHRRSNYMVSVRMNSTRTDRTESGNGENIQGYYLPDGGTTIMVRGNEYANIFPCWTWSRIPGVTAPEKIPAPKPTNWGEDGTTSFTGGVTDNHYGAAVYTQNWDGVVAKKSWFFFDDMVVALGAGIQSGNTQKITTTLEQKIANGDVWVSPDNINFSLESPSAGKKLSGIKTVWHDSVGYAVLSGQDLNYVNETVIGDWHDISNDQFSPGTTITKDVFTLYLDHGIQPADADYAYGLYPAVSKNELPQVISDNPVAVISNTENIQAVRHEILKRTNIVFYQKDTIEVAPGYVVSANHPCIIMIDENGALPVVSAANPHGSSLSLDILIEKDNTTYTASFNLPGENEGGKSVTVTARKKAYPLIAGISSEPQSDYTGEKLLDNNLDDSSRWSADTYPQWVIIDYGKDTLISGTKLWTYQNRAYQYLIWACSDINNCKNENAANLIVDRSLNTETAQPLVDTIDEVTARYVKIKVTGVDQYAGTWVSLREFQIFTNDIVTDDGDHHVAAMNLSVFPNPVNVSAEFYIEFSEPDHTGSVIELFDLHGKRLECYKANAGNMDNTLYCKAPAESGIYILTITNAGNISHHLLIVQ